MELYGEILEHHTELSLLFEKASRKQGELWVLREQQECFYATFLLLLGQGFPDTLHDAATLLWGQDNLLFVVLIREENAWCLLFPLNLPALHFLPHPSMDLKNQTPFDKMFCLLVREKKAKHAGTASKSELWELPGANQGTRVQATQKIPLLNMNWEADLRF